MNKILKNWGYLLISDIIQQIVGFVVVISLAVKLSPNGYGLFNVIISVGTIFSVVANFGMTNVVIREISLNPKTTICFVKKIIVPFRIFFFIISIVSYLAYNYLSSSLESEWFFYVVLIVLNLSLWNFSESIAFGHEITKISSILNIGSSVIWLVTILLLPESMFTIHRILLIYCFLHFLKALAYVILLLKIFFSSIEFNKESTNINFSYFFKILLPYVWLLLIFTIAGQIPIQFLNANSNIDSVAYYAVGLKLMMPVSIAMGTAFKAIFPAFTRLYSKDRQEFKNKIELSFKLIIILGTVIATASSITSHYWVPLLFGEEYREAVDVFNLLIWFSVFSVLDTLLSNGLSSAYKEKVLVFLATVDVLILIPVLYVLSFDGATGIAIGKLLTGFVFFGYHLYVFARVLNLNIINKSLVFLIVFYVSSFCISFFLNNIIFQLVIFSFVFFIFLLIRNSPIVSTYSFVKQKIKHIRCNL